MNIHQVKYQTSMLSVHSILFSVWPGVSSIYSHLGTGKTTKKRCTVSPARMLHLDKGRASFQGGNLCLKRAVCLRLDSFRGMGF